MKPTEIGNFSPVLLLEIELSQPLSNISLVHPNRRKRYTRAQVLVRIHGNPIGYIHVTSSSDELAAEVVSRMIWEELQVRITQYLSDNNLPAIDRIGTSGLSEMNVPSYIQTREQLLRDAPFVSIVVTTHNRADSLEDTLRSISAVKYPRFEIIIVDNAPSNDEAAELVKRLSSEYNNLHYFQENRIGLCWARNRGLEAAQGVITVFTDDDVLVDPDWLTALVQGFSIGDNVACVTGLILPRELETPAQVWCEEHGGFGKGFTSQIFDMGTHRPADPLFPYRLSMFGSGANMCFRTDILRRFGGSDPVMGAGTPTRSAAEFSAFYNVIMNNYQIVYRADAIVYHSHHEKYESFRQQFYGYGVGFTAFLTKIILENPRVILGLLKRLVDGLFFIFDPQSPRHAKKEADYPRELNRLEVLGMLYGPIAYFRSRSLVRKNKRS
jgi:glycosyltransferase involved in cell wall biosynthesis